MNTSAQYIGEAMGIPAYSEGFELPSLVCATRFGFPVYSKVRLTPTGVMYPPGSCLVLNRNKLSHGAGPFTSEADISLP